MKGDHNAVAVKEFQGDDNSAAVKEIQGDHNTANVQEIWGDDISATIKTYGQTKGMEGTHTPPTTRQNV